MSFEWNRPYLLLRLFLLVVVVGVQRSVASQHKNGLLLREQVSLLVAITGITIRHR